jgi:hypothetical protein
MVKPCTSPLRLRGLNCCNLPESAKHEAELRHLTRSLRNDPDACTEVDFETTNATVVGLDELLTLLDHDEEARKNLRIFKEQFRPTALN